MKTLLKLSALMLCLTFAVPHVMAQDVLLKKFGNKIKQRKNRKIDQGMDKVLDKIEEAAGNSVKGDDKKDTSSDDAKSVEDAATPSNQPVDTDQPIQENTNQETKERNAGFDLSGMMGGNKEMEPLPEGNYSGGSKPEKGVIGKGPFGVASGMMVIKTTTDNKMVKMNQLDTLYFDQYGNRQVRYQHSTQKVNMMGIKNEETSHTINHILGDSLFTVDVTKRTGTSMMNPASDFYNGMSEEEAEKFAEQLAKDMKADVKYLGTDKYLGKICEVYDTKMYTEEGNLMAHSRIWMRKGLTYKSESRAMGVDVFQEALVVKENASVSARRFKKVAGISYTYFNYFDKNE